MRMGNIGGPDSKVLSLVAQITRSQALTRRAGAIRLNQFLYLYPRFKRDVYLEPVTNSKSFHLNHVLNLRM